MSPSRNGDDVTITLGVEEELFLVDPDSRDLLSDPDPGIFEACIAAGGGQQVVREFLRSQIETNTAVHDSVAGVREGLTAARRIVVNAARAHGAAVIATSAHPFAAWEAQLPTPKDRYRQFASTYQETVRRLVICGMHVHAGFGDFDTRVRVMTALRRYLPLFIGLSASSPFGEGRESGFKCNRLNLFEAMPRTSIPGPLHSHAEYEALLGEYRRMAFIKDGSEIWWDIRPSHKFPTVELRICDTCPRPAPTWEAKAAGWSPLRCATLSEAGGDAGAPSPAAQAPRPAMWRSGRAGAGPGRALQAAPGGRPGRRQPRSSGRGSPDSASRRRR